MDTATASVAITTAQALMVAGAIIATMFGLLAAILGWTGSRLFNAVQSIRMELAEITRTMHSIELDMHGKIGNLDRRVTRVEVKCGMSPKGGIDE